jgi:hypothetical protein
MNSLLPFSGIHLEILPEVAPIQIIEICADFLLSINCSLVYKYVWWLTKMKSVLFCYACHLFLFPIHILSITFKLNKRTSVAATHDRSETSIRKCKGKQIVLEMEWNSRIMVARTIYLNVIKIDIQLVEIYNTHNMVRKILYTEYDT